MKKKNWQANRSVIADLNAKAFG